MIILSAIFGFRSSARAGVSANPGVSPWQPLRSQRFSRRQSPPPQSSPAIPEYSLFNPEQLVGLKKIFQ